jgi:dihydrofolate synthase/folylpolyglutamate synthase
LTLSSPSLPSNLSDWLELLERRHPKAIDLGLERCGAVWRQMGSPRPSSRIFMVAGTNGKGSTVATICALLDALGHSYGSYTSPHLARYNERVRLQGEPVPDETLLQAFERVEAARGDVSLSYFEFGTLAAISILSRASLDYSVMEVGLGGRLDAVNLLDAECAVITPIGLDHQDYLGDDLLSIGREKAGIIRPGRPVVCGEANPPASIIETALAHTAPLKRLGVDFSIKRLNGLARFNTGGLEMEVPLPVLDGPHQLNNMATALAALLELIPAAAADPEALVRGLCSVSLSGRFERALQQPAVWVDVGHNPMAARAVAVTVGATMKAEGIAQCRCVLAMLADKDAPAVVEELRSAVTGWYCAGLEGDRGQTGPALARRVEQVDEALEIHVFKGVTQALDAAISDSRPGDGVLVFGSFLTATEALQHLAPDTDRILNHGPGIGQSD